MTHLLNSNGSLVYEYSYDAWGRLRNPASRDVYAPGNEPTLFLDRGYTGHEHLPLFGLINKNARLYDPTVGRFLSPDPYIQSLDFTQSFNRYGYCLNNPLVYTDKDGEFWHIVIGAAVGGVTNWLTNGAKFNWKGLGYFGVGAAAGAAGGWAGGAVSGVLGTASTFGEALANEVASGGTAGFSSGSIGGAGNAWIGGASFGKGLQAGLISGGFGALGGLSSGIRYQRQNYIFQNGLSDLGVDAGDAVPAIDQFLSDAQKAWFKDAPMNNIKDFTVENVPINTQNIMDATSSPAVTRALQKAGVLTGNSLVYFNKNLAFSSAKQLYFTMGHEFVHVSQIAVLAGESMSLLQTIISFNGNTAHFTRDLLEFHAYSYQHSVGGTSIVSFAPSLVREMANQWSSYFNKLGYSNFGWTKTANFIYPF
jgi:RHS repeat-associated protein